jgi:hypothetical protein
MKPSWSHMNQENSSVFLATLDEISAKLGQSQSEIQYIALSDYVKDISLSQKKCTHDRFHRSIYNRSKSFLFSSLSGIEIKNITKCDVAVLGTFGQA